MKVPLLNALLFACAVGNSQTIVTVAGLSVGHRGDLDGKSALNPLLQRVYGLLVDRVTGRLILHDEIMVERLEPDGTLLVLAGSGYPTQGATVDGTPASTLQVGILRGIAQDAAGALYLADAAAGRVYRIGPDGIVSTFAGGGTAPGLSGDGGLATATSLPSPRGIVFDSKGNLDIAEVFCGCIRRVTPAGIISTVYTLPDPRPFTNFTHFEGLAIDSQDNLYATEYVGHQVMKIRADGTVTTVAGTGLGGFSGDGGPATAAQLNGPSGVAVAADGTLYIADTRNHRIRKIAPDGIITTVAGTGTSGFSGDAGPALAARLQSPAQVLVQPDGTLYIADWGNQRVRMIAPNGIISTLAGGVDSAHPPQPTNGDGGPALTATFNTISAVAFDHNGNLLVTDVTAGRVRKITPDGNISTFAGTNGFSYSGEGGPAIDASIPTPYGLAIDALGSVYLATGDSRIRRIDTGGTINLVAGVGTGTGLNRSQGDGGPAVNATLNEPKGVAFDAAGNIYIADTSNARLRVIDRTGTIRTLAGPGVQGSDYWNGVALDPRGNIYVSITHAFITREWSEIDRVNGDGSLAPIVGNNQPCTEASKDAPFDGQQATAIPLCVVIGFTFDAQGNLYIPDSYLGLLLRMSPDGRISRIAGNTHATQSGDGGPALAARLSGAGYFPPPSVAIDAAGNMFLPSGNRIREVTGKALALTLSRATVDLLPGQSQTVGVTTNFGEPFPYLVRTQTTGTGGWLTVNRASAQSGEPFAVTANASGLPSGVYRGTVTVILQAPTPLQVDLPVSLTVQ